MLPLSGAAPLIPALQTDIAEEVGSALGVARLERGNVEEVSKPAKPASADSPGLTQPDKFKRPPANSGRTTIRQSGAFQDTIRKLAKAPPMMHAEMPKRRGESTVESLA